MNDILPDEARRWHRVEAVFRRTAELYGYGEVRTPLLEDTSLFERQIGETTDVVEKEMYSFERHGDRMTVRPEGTAGAARAFVEHGLAAKEPVTRWYYLGPMFRGERPAKGRYRQFHQAGCELFGDAGPVADAEMIELVVRVLAGIGVGATTVHINSLGGAGTRERYRDALVAFFGPKRQSLSEDSQRRLEKNPLRILDSKDPKDVAAREGAPSILETISEADRVHFDGVKAALDALGIPYVVDDTLVRGLDYYTRTLFEVKATEADLGAQSTVCGGGRYDDMVESLGGPKTPAIGFAMGIERLLVAMKDAEAKAKPAPIYVAVLGEAALPVGLRLARELRDLGRETLVDARDAKLKAMLRRADSAGVRHCVLIGDDEAKEGVVTVKDLAAHAQDKIPLASAARVIADRAAAPGPVETNAPASGGAA
ncbi:MAG TPA: histidine--tRNA ligase [Polyangiaceae bacterium]|nr:histidine--tRNA ligase [Polyangiaceae bacterium]